MRQFKAVILFATIIVFTLIIQLITQTVDAKESDLGDSLRLEAISANPIKLNGLLQPAGDVYQARFSADEKYIVYRADQNDDEVHELYSVPVTGGSSVRLNKDLPDGVDIFSFGITSDNQRVIYMAAQNDADVTELFSVPINGPSSAGVRLNITPVQFGNVNSAYVIENYVVYKGDLERDGYDELYRVPITGPASASEKLHAPFQGSGSVYRFTISPDRKNVVYSAYKPPQNGLQVQLFSVPLLGPVSSTKPLTAPLPQGSYVQQIRVSPDSSTVVYQADGEVVGRQEFYSVPITGPISAVTKLSNDLAGGESVESQFFISTDSKYVVYMARLAGHDVREIYSVPIAGPATSSVRLTVDLAVNENVYDSLWHVTKDGTNLVYAVYESFDFKWLYRVPIAGTSNDNHLLLGVPDTNSSDMGTYATTQDGQHVIFNYRLNYDEPYEMYSTPIDGVLGAETKLNVPLPDNGFVTSWITISPNSQWLFYLAKTDTSVGREIYAVPVAGPYTESIKVNSPLVAGGYVSQLDNIISPNGTYIAYLAAQDTVGMQELYLSPGNSLFYSNFVYLPLVSAE